MKEKSQIRQEKIAQKPPVSAVKSMFSDGLGGVILNITSCHLTLFKSTTKWIRAEKNTYVATMESQVAA